MTRQEARRILLEAWEKVKNIPEESFIGHRFSNGTDKCCFIGHLIRLKSHDPTDYRLHNCSDSFLNPHPIRKASRLILEEYDVAEVNNGYSPRYNEPTPKQRIEAFINDVAKEEYERSTLILA